SMSGKMTTSISSPPRIDRSRDPFRLGIVAHGVGGDGADTGTRPILADLRSHFVTIASGAGDDARASTQIRLHLRRPQQVPHTSAVDDHAWTGHDPASRFSMTSLCAGTPVGDGQSRTCLSISYTTPS